MTLSQRATTALTMLSLVRSGRAFVPSAPRVLSARLKSCSLLDGSRRRPAATAGRLIASSRRDSQALRNGRAIPGELQAGREARMLQITGVRRPAPRVVSLPAVTVGAARHTTASALDEVTPGLFSDLDLSRNTLAAISDVLGYANMTNVQERAIPISLTGVDLLAKAKTGTGKTLAFLIPAIERVVARGDSNGVSALIISPTRELAQQIAEEAQQVMSFHRLKLMCAVGGVNINRDLNQMKAGPPDVIVATPGRLNELLENQGLRRHVKNLDTLVFDEADHLLEMGFRPTIDSILRNLPSKMDRQTILFSATMPGDVQAMANLAMRSNFELVDCVGEEENTHKHVAQKVAISSLAELPVRLLVALTKAKEDPDHKVIVFFVAARVVQAYAELFNGIGVNVLETHSRKSQAARTRVSEAFRNGKGVIMFTSDVSARGLDYPDVSLVVQVGLPTDQNQYIHRLGRTARAGKGGSGLLLLADAERGFLREVKDLSLEEADTADPGSMVEARQRVAEGRVRVSETTVQMAYAAWLGFYKGNLKRLKWDPETLVREANAWATQFWGLPSPPALQAKTVGKMGLQRVPGIVIDNVAQASRGGYSDGGRQAAGRGDRSGGRAAGRGRSKNNQRRASSTLARNGEGEQEGNFGGRGAEASVYGGRGRGRGGASRGRERIGGRGGRR